MNAANQLYIVNTTNGTFALQGTVSGLPAASGGGDMAFSPTGVCYLLTNGNLYTVNIGARTSALVGATGIASPTGLCFAQDGNLYASNLAVSSQMYLINPASGASTPMSGTAGIDINDLTAMPKFANLSITKAATGTFAVNRNAVYTLTVRNNGPQSASGPLVVSDTLPSGLSFVSGTGTGWTCSALSGVVTCNNNGPLANATNSVITLTVAVTAPAAPNVTNTASVSGTTFDHVPDNNSSTVTTPVMYITVVKSVNPPPPGPYAPGTDLTYSITFTNAGNVDARNFVVYDDIPAATYFKVGSQTSPPVPFDVITGVTVSYTGGTPTSGGGGAPAGYDARITRITWTFTGGNLRPGVSRTVTFVARIK